MSSERERVYALLDSIVANAEEARTVLDSVLLVPKPEPATDVITVAVGQSVQAAYNSLLTTGGVIKLAPGRHVGELKLGARPEGCKLITVTSDSENLPGPGQRISPEYAEALGTIVSTRTTTAPLRCENQSRNVAFVNVGVGPPATSSYSIIDMGGDRRGMLTPADRPDSFTFDRCYLYGDPVTGARRGLQCNASNVTLINSYIKDCIQVGRDAQAVGAWNGAQNILLKNNHLEGGAENIMFGGSDCASIEMIPQDIVIEECLLTKVYNDAWKAASIKCLFEVKNVKRLRMTRCLLEQNWRRDWATGVAVMLKCANQEGSNPYATCEDVTLENLVLRNVGSVFGIIGKNDAGQPSDWMRRVIIRNVLAYNINVAPWLGTGRGCELANGAEEGFTLDHITMHTNGHSWMNTRFDSGLTRSPGALTVTNSMLAESSYGYLSEKNGIGFTALAADWNGSTVAGNVWKLGSRGQGTLPPDNLRLTPAAWESSIGADHLVIPGSPADAVVTTDGHLPGANVEALPTVYAEREDDIFV